MSDQQPFEHWALVEIFGHTRLAGRVSEATIGGCSFVRVDVPETSRDAAFTRFYGQGAIYSITLVDEAVARAAVERLHAAPLSIYLPQLQAIPQRASGAPDDDDRYNDDRDDPF